MADPVAWVVIEKGWRVVGSDGGELGEVDEVVGDSGVDIFNGLSVSTGWLDAPKYVPSEQVTTIVEGEIRLALDRRTFERLGDHVEPPPSLEIDGDEASRSDRVADAFTDLEHKPRAQTPLRRVLGRIFRR